MKTALEVVNFEGLNALAARYFDISVTETQLLRQCTSTKSLATQQSRKRHPIRAMFLRWLVTDLDCIKYIDPLGLRVTDAEISTDLNLDFCKPGFPLWFHNCGFKSRFSLQSATLPALTLSHCTTFHGITANNLRVDGAVSLEFLQSQGEIRFLAARIGGGLSCAGAQLEGIPSLTADRAQILGGVFLNSQFCAAGTISLQDSIIGGDLSLDEASLHAADNALFADGVQVTGDINLTNQCEARGTIRLIGAQVGGKLQCTGASLLAGNANALSLDGARIKGDVRLDRTRTPTATLRFHDTVVEGDFNCDGACLVNLECKQTRVTGDFLWTNVTSPMSGGKPEFFHLTLTDSNVGTFRDDRGSWPPDGGLHIQGFVYKSLISDTSPTVDAETRIEWLKKQPSPEVLSRQPWTQLVNLLEANGDSSGAKKVTFAFKQQQAYQDGVAWGLINEPVHLLQERPWGVLPVIGSAWAIGSLVFWRAHRLRAMAPTDKTAYDAFAKGNNLPRHYTPFNPVIYTLENVLPVVDLGQDGAWGPNPQIRSIQESSSDPLSVLLRRLPRFGYIWLSILRWVLILLGWALALILGAVIGGLFKP
jgi:hypothetical protein